MSQTWIVILLGILAVAIYLAVSWLRWSQQRRNGPMQHGTNPGSASTLLDNGSGGGGGGGGYSRPFLHPQDPQTHARAMMPTNVRKERHD